MMDEQPNTMNKLMVGTASGGLGTFVAIVLAWALKQWAHVDMPSEVQMAVAGIIATASTATAAHFTPVNKPEDPPTTT